MEKIQATVLAVIIGSLLISTGVKLTDDNVYYCESRELVKVCGRLSSTAKTCYNQEGKGTRCTEGWVEVDNDLEITVTPEPSQSRQYLCNQEGCVAK